jgi:uncharacterized protein involved in outer membrane biogenesis
LSSLSPTFHPRDLHRPLSEAARELKTRTRVVLTHPKHRRLRIGMAVSVAVVVLIAILVALFDWNMLRGPIARFASAQTGREVRIDGDLHVKLFSWTPTVRVEGVSIGEPAWVKARGRTAPMAAARELTVAVRLMPLFRGRVELPLIAVTRPNLSLLRDKTGQANWDFGKKDANAKPMKLPPITTFVISNGRIVVADEGRGLTLNAGIEAHEEATAAYSRGFTLKGEGSINKAPFTMNVVGGPLINVRADRPYPFTAAVTADGTQIDASGQVVRPFDLGRVTATLGIKGRDLADLYLLTGLTLPNTPPYAVYGRFAREGTRYTYDDFSGRVGRSDLSGDAAVETKGVRPHLTADITSKSLDFDDLGALFGAPGTSKAAAPAQKAAVGKLIAQERIFPDAPLDTKRLRSMDADVKYRAASVRAPGGLPLRAVSVTTRLKDAVLTLDPVSLTLPRGKVNGSAVIDGRKDAPFSAIDFRIADVRVEDFMTPVDGSKPIEGAIRARIKLSGGGDSIHRFAAASDGAVTGVIPHGEMRQAFAELLGIDATKGLFMLLGKDHSPTPVRCAIADFRVANGVMRADRIVFDTGVVVAEGSGTVDLGRETYDLRFKGAPKKLRAVRLMAPITVKGPLRAPNFGLEPGAAIAQAGAGLALASLLGPLAVILPFVDPGLAKNADCAGLFAEARQSEAHVNAPRSTPVPETGKKGSSLSPVSDKAKKK